MGSRHSNNSTGLRSSSDARSDGKTDSDPRYSYYKSVKKSGDADGGKGGASVSGNSRFSDKGSPRGVRGGAHSSK